MLQNHENSLQISFNNGFATKQLCCKKPCCNSVSIGNRLQKSRGFATEIFCCYVAMDSHPLLILLLNPNSQKTLNGLKFFIFNCLLIFVKFFFLIGKNRYILSIKMSQRGSLAVYMRYTKGAIKP